MFLVKPFCEGKKKIYHNLIIRFGEFENVTKRFAGRFSRSTLLSVCSSSTYVSFFCKDKSRDSIYLQIEQKNLNKEKGRKGREAIAAVTSQDE